jgi:hypothetical protein
VELWEVTERQHVFPGIVHRSSSFGETLRQRRGQVSQRLRISAAFAWANTERRAAVTMPWWAVGTLCSRFLEK